MRSLWGQREAEVRAAAEAAMEPWLLEVFKDWRIPDAVWARMRAIQPAEGNRPFVPNLPILA